MEFYKFDVAILNIMLFGYFMAGKLRKKGGHKMAKKQNFQNLFIKFVELLQTKF